MEKDDLLQRAMSGDDGALEELLRLVQRLAARRPRSPQFDPEEIAQEAMVRLYKMRGKLDMSQTLPVVLTVIRNVERDCQRLIDYQNRRAKTLRETEADPGWSDAASAAMKREDALAGVSPEAKRVFALKTEGKTTKEIAELLQVSEKRVSRLEAQLGAHLEGVTLADSVGAKRKTKEPATTTSPARIVIAWDPETVPPTAYSRIVEILGDIVRENGGRGVERIREQATGIGTPAPVEA